LNSFLGRCLTSPEQAKLKRMTLLLVLPGMTGAANIEGRPTILQVLFDQFFSSLQKYAFYAGLFFGFPSVF